MPFVFLFNFKFNLGCYIWSKEGVSISRTRACDLISAVDTFKLDTTYASKERVNLELNLMKMLIRDDDVLTSSLLRSSHWCITFSSNFPFLSQGNNTTESKCWTWCLARSDRLRYQNLQASYLTFTSPKNKGHPQLRVPPREEPNWYTIWQSQREHTLDKIVVPLEGAGRLQGTKQDYNPREPWGEYSATVQMLKQSADSVVLWWGGQKRPHTCPNFLETAA